MTKAIIRMSEDKEDNVKTQVSSFSLSEENITHIQQPTELGESLRELNSDKIDMISRMSDIDLRARLYPVEIGSILAMDSLVALGVLPVKCLSFSRSKKRLSVSLQGLGRREIVDIVAGKKERDIAGGLGGFTDKLKGFFGMGQR